MVGLLLPWTWRNARLFHAFLPLTTSAGVNLVGGNNAQADGGFVWSGPYVLTGMNEVDSQRQYTTLALDWIKSNPLAFLRLLPREGSPLPLALVLQYLRLPESAAAGVHRCAVCDFSILWTCGGWDVDVDQDPSDVGGGGPGRGLCRTPVDQPGNLRGHAILPSGLPGDRSPRRCRGRELVDGPSDPSPASGLAPSGSGSTVGLSQIRGRPCPTQPLEIERPALEYTPTG